MTILNFIGAATAVSQVTTVTLSGTWSSGDTITLKVAEKEVTYTCGSGETTTTVAAALLALAKASNDPEFGEAVWTAVTNVLTATGTAGVPLTIACTETAASGSVSVSTTTDATGPNHWDNVDNWSTGAVPTTNDTVYIDDENARVLYGLPTTSLTLTKVVHRRGQLGLPDRNTAGYTEYRTKRAAFTCTSVEIGVSPGVGPTFSRIDTGSANATITVFGSAVSKTSEVVNVTMNHSSSQLNIISGQVAIAPLGTETSTVGTVRVAKSAAVKIGSGVTVTTVTSSGVCESFAAITTLNVNDGTTTTVGSGTVGTLTVIGGTHVNKSTGTITTANVGPGTMDCSQDIRSKTITTLNFNKSGRIVDPYKSLTITALVLGANVTEIVAN